MDVFTLDTGKGLAPLRGRPGIPIPDVDSLDQMRGRIPARRQ
jgi:hypothetical protein